ncbi:MAG: GDP-mannose 4,6-dehydratase [Promethearchaeota archaeon]
MYKILITGSNGFIGSHLIDLLINKNYKVYALDRPFSSFKNLLHYTDGKLEFSEKEKLDFIGERIKNPSNNKNLILLECDIKNGLLLEKIIQEIKPDYLFHFAAQPFIIPSWENPIDTIETNVIGTINVFEPIKRYKLKTRVIVACTAAEFGTTTKLNRPLKEIDPLMATNPYGISKIAAELLSRQYFINFGIETINIRFFNLTGIRRTNDAPSDFIRNVVRIDLGLQGPTFTVGNLRPYRDFTDVLDAIQGIWLAAMKGTPGETYHICSNKKIQIRTLLNIALGFSKNQIQVEENVANKLRKTDEDILIGDNSKITKELGFKITRSIEETMREMYEYWIDYGKNKEL